jgi:hypothetical protein
MAQIQQQLLRRQQQQQQQAQLMNGMGAQGMVFQNPNGGAQQLRGGMPNGLYAGTGPGGVPGANMGAYGAGNPHMRNNVNLAPHVQQQLQQAQQQQQQQQMAAAQQMMANQANAAANAQTPMSMPQQPQMPMQAISHAQQAAMAAAQARGIP